MKPRRSLAVAWLAIALWGSRVVVTPVAAEAHAEVVAATPAPGLGLPQAPAAVVMKFSEPLNLGLSSIDVLDASGSDVGRGPTRGVPGDPNAMQRRVGVLEAGRYTVRWTTVSDVDGHTLQGSYSFGVGTAASGAETVQQSPLRSEGLAGIIGHLAALAGLALWAGFAAIGGAAERAELRVGALGRVAPYLVAGGTAIAIASGAIVARGSLAAIPAVVLGGSSGAWRLAELAAAVIAIASRGRSRALERVLAVVALVAEAASGHAVATPVPVLATALSTLHLAAVGVWVFAIAASVSARQGAPRALRLFSPYAIGSAAVVAVTGVCNAAFELGAANDLLSTGYGKTLLAKGVAFVAMAGLGFLHYTRRRRRAEPARLVRPLRAEAVAAAVAVTLAAVLVAFPTPPRESEAAARLTSADPLLASLPGRPALSVAGASGPFVVTLTILPPSPGEVRLHVSVLGVQAGDGLRHARVVGSSSRGRRLNVALGPCGLGCFEGRAAITAGAWRLETRITTNRGPATLTLHVPLPTPGGAPELRRAIAAMDGLHTARMLETLRSSARGRAVVSHYAYRAPDAFRVAVAGGTTRIVIGRAEFDRPQSARAWTKTPWPGSPFTWPRSYYASLWDGAAAARVLGRQQLHGRRTEIVAFVRPNLPAWFRLWVGVADGVVYREQMLAEGHIMNHRYRPNAPVAIRRPRRES